MNLVERKNWILLTAGLSDGPIRQASHRLIAQARKLFPFGETLIVTKENIGEICPYVSQVYPEYLNEKCKGFGFYSWKPEALYSILASSNLRNTGVIWIDAGCEINSNFASKHLFRAILKSAIKNGGWFYGLRTREDQYTKRDLLLRFKEVAKIHPDIQVQANFLVLYGDDGLKIAKKWLELATERIENIDFSISKSGENSDFVQHRNDQSLLSIIVKQLGYGISRLIPPSRPKSNSGRLKGFVSPVWVARNRSGVSILSRARKNRG